MATRTLQPEAPQPAEPVMRWLLDSDPSIRWQVMRDLSGEIVTGTRNQDGRWPLYQHRPDPIQFDMEDGSGEPGRWNTLRALRVLDWYGAQ